ncbi:DUF1735 domain-containing protein [Pedobacter borealis]|uniref:DUF1735 domain-containing protein n=1 Tax=Pedobacter borealis TaxID=475254 RepID=UPI00049345EA|nr:DUF1735 domain-containing protein [Pedobacter borealis]
MKKNIFKSIILLLAVTSLTSCLKDDSLVLDPAKGHNVIEFANPAQIAVNGTPSPLYVFSYDAASTPTLPITISYSGPEAVAPQDITVKFTVGSQAKIDEYNTATSNHYVMLKPVSYTLSTNEVVIKAGTSKATFNIALKPSTFDFAVSEVLPLTITSASSGIISGNFSTILLNLGAKNKFDGVYTYYALHEAPDRPTFLIGTEFKYPNDVQLRTTGASKDNLFNTYYGDFLIPLLTSTNGTSGFGSTNLVLEFDPATNKVISAANANIAPANGRAMNLDLTANNYFDPATHNVFVTYFMTQPGFSPLKITARLVYKGSR